MRAKFRRALIVSAVFSLSACTTIEAATKQAVRYNSAFTNARNEILLLNILRAQNGEPLQFSTISTVQGPMRGNIEVSNTLDWIFHGADEVRKLTPDGGFTFRDPTITITPLESKEFREGMMKPVSVEYLNQLVDQEWPVDLVEDMLITVKDCELRSVKEKGVIVKTEREALIPSENAGELLREGAGKGVSIELVGSANDRPEKVRVRFRTEQISIADTTRINPNICPSGLINVKNTTLRSPLAIIRYLAKRTKSSEYPFLKLESGRLSKSDPTLVATVFRETTYSVPRNEKYAETLALLAEIIGFQTMNAELNANKPIVAIPAG